MSGLNQPVDMSEPVIRSALAEAAAAAGNPTVFVASRPAGPTDQVGGHVEAKPAVQPNAKKESRAEAKKRLRDQERWLRLAGEASSALAFIDSPARARLGVTSCMRGEGRSTVAAATALAQCLEFGLETILVELDLEKPSVAGLLGLEPSNGVAEVLRGEAHLDACIQWTRSDLGVLVAGDVRTSASKLISHLMTSDLMDELQRRCEVVVADLPPFSGPGARVAGLCASVLLVVRAGATSLDHVRRAAAELDGPPIMLNRVTASMPRWIGGMFGVTR